jgi:hypothetical protein
MEDESYETSSLTWNLKRKILKFWQDISSIQCRSGNISARHPVMFMLTLKVKERIT